MKQATIIRFLPDGKGKAIRASLQMPNISFAFMDNYGERATLLLAGIKDVPKVKEIIIILENKQNEHNKSSNE